MQLPAEVTCLSSRPNRPIVILLVHDHCGQRDPSINRARTHYTRVTAYVLRTSSKQFCLVPFNLPDFLSFFSFLFNFVLNMQLCSWFELRDQCLELSRARFLDLMQTQPSIIVEKLRKRYVKVRRIEYAPVSMKNGMSERIVFLKFEICRLYNVSIFFKNFRDFRK